MQKIFFLLLLFLSGSLSAQQAADTWSNVPPAGDDRYTNPKKPLYAGPNGWYDFGEVRVAGVSSADLTYSFKGGFHLQTGMFIAVEPGAGLKAFHMDFGTEAPPGGTYQADKTADVKARKVKVFFTDLSRKNEVIEWSAGPGAGTVTVSGVNGFIYFKCRNVTLQPSGLNNSGISGQAVRVGFEGAVKP